MTYKINKTDGNLLAEIPDGTYDSSSSSITLIGKNVTSFGEAINENFVKLLENFSSSSAPSNPIKGQLWYDTSTGRLNVYDGVNFRTSGGPLIGTSTPLTPVTGDLWVNNETNQLWFYDGTEWTLAGPIYEIEQGVTGFKVETVTDTANRSHVICLLYVANTLLGIFSKTEFTPKFTITGYGPPGTKVKIGFNVAVFTSTNSSAATALNALGSKVSLALVSGSAAAISIINVSTSPNAATGITLTPYVSYDNGATWEVTEFYEPIGQITSPTLSNLSSLVGQSRTIVIGSGATAVEVRATQWQLGAVTVQLTTSTPSGIKFNVTASAAESLLLEDGVSTRTASELAILTQENVFTQPLTLQSNLLSFGSISQVQMRLLNNNLLIEHQIDDKDISLRVKSAAVTRDGITVKGTGRVGIFNPTPEATLDVAGDVKVSGNLIVGGETVSVNVSDVKVEDKNIELGVTASPTDSLADGGGITLKGTSDKKIWYNDATKAWDISENINIPTGKTFKINNVTILSSTSLGSTVTSAPGITSVGTLTALQVDFVNINSNIISATGTNRSLILAPTGTGTVDVSNKKIVNLANPTADQDVTNKSYVDQMIFKRPLAIGLDITGLDANLQPGEDINTRIAGVLDKIAPYYNASTAPEGVAINNTVMRVHATKTDFATQTVTHYNKLFIMTAGYWLFNNDFV